MIVRGGSLATPEGMAPADLVVEDGSLAEIGPELPGGAHETGARGLTVFPGLIDVHEHFTQPGRDDGESAATGSRALAAGGGTMFFDMPLNSSPCTVGTLGACDVFSGAVNGVPMRLRLEVDVRDIDGARRDSVLARPAGL